ncbi:MAG: hypothetical protein NT099_07785 [Candidatus Saganbacteria bacterium]|nr:hypothetical protein [Candidatus Saganbacteria bacterium]
MFELSRRVCFYRDGGSSPSKPVAPRRIIVRLQAPVVQPVPASKPSALSSAAAKAAERADRKRLTAETGRMERLMEMGRHILEKKDLTVADLDMALGIFARVYRDDPSHVEAARAVVDIFYRETGLAAEVFTADDVEVPGLTPPQKASIVTASRSLYVARILSEIPPAQMTEEGIRSAAPEIVPFIFGIPEKPVPDGLAAALEFMYLCYPETRPVVKKRAGGGEEGADLRLIVKRVEIGEALLEAARKSFDAGRYAEAAEGFSHVLPLEPGNVEALCSFHLSALRRDYPFLVGAEPEVTMHRPVRRVEHLLLAKLEGVRVKPRTAGSREIERIEREVAQAREVRSLEELVASGELFAKPIAEINRPGRLELEIQAQKDELLVTARECFERGEYAQAAEAFYSALELDPVDGEMFFRFHLSALRRDYPFLLNREERNIEQIRVFLLEERFEKTLKVIPFLRERPAVSIDEIRAGKEGDPLCAEILRYVDHRACSRVVGNFYDAQVVSGVVLDLEAWDQFKVEIEAEAASLANVLSLEKCHEKHAVLAEAMECFGRAEYEQAENVFGRVLEIDPNDIWVLCHLLICRMEQANVLFPENGAKSVQNKGTAIVRVLKHSIQVLDFIRAHPLYSTTEILEADSVVFNLITGGSERSMFSCISDARVCAGVIYDPTVLESMKMHIQERVASTRNEITTYVLPMPVPKERQARTFTPVPPLPADIKTRKDALVAEAQMAFREKRYAEAVASFHSAAELDPNDIEVFCNVYVSILHRDYPFLDVPPREGWGKRIGRGYEMRFFRAERRLRQRLEVIRFLGSHAGMRYVDLRKEGGPIFSLIVGQETFRVFGNGDAPAFLEAMVAAGQHYDPAIIAGIKEDIVKEYRAATGEARDEA